MKLEHYYVSLLDVPDILPFAAPKKETLEEDLKEQENAEKKTWEFLSEIEKHLIEEIYYVGQDNIENKFYQRFMFNKNGFLEIILERPCAIVAHFTTKERADLFAEGLKKALAALLPDNEITKLLTNSIEVSCESAGSLTYSTWSKLKTISGDIR